MKSTRDLPSLSVSKFLLKRLVVAALINYLILIGYLTNSIKSCVITGSNFVLFRSCFQANETPLPPPSFSRETRKLSATNQQCSF